MSENYVEIRTFKRMYDGKIALDGVIWSTNFEKAIEIKNDETGNKVHSIKIGDMHYYPIAFQPQRKKTN